MSQIEVRTQAELDKAVKNQKPGDVIVCLGGTIWNPLIVGGSSRVEARDNKVKVPRVSGAVYEVDVHGDPIEQKQAA